jgi:hypothetical protein
MLLGPNLSGKPGRAGKLSATTDEVGTDRIRGCFDPAGAVRAAEACQAASRQGLRLRRSPRWLRACGIMPRIARRGIEDPTLLGRHRWKIERTIAWLTGYRRLTIRYERHGPLFSAFLQLAAALTCYKKLPT